MTEVLPPRVRESLRRKRRTARAVLVFEGAWPALWPALGVLGGFVCAALLELPQRLPPWLHLAVLAAVFAGVVTLGWRGVRPLVLPDASAADRRLERDSGLSHRPLAALSDQPAPGTGDAAVWQAHLARLAGTVARLRLHLPRPGLAARDPRAWRALLLLGLAVALGVAGADAPARLLAAVQPDFPPPAAPVAPRLTAWVTPPGYTGMAPMLLDTLHGEVSVPTGSRLTASLSAGSGEAPVLALAGHEQSFQPLALDDRGGGSWQATRLLDSGGTLSVRRGDQNIARWQVTAVADVPPSIQWQGDPGATAGRAPQLRLPWQVAHVYGVATLQAELVLQQRPAARPLVVTVPLPDGAPRAARGVKLTDLLSSPWAGLPVVATLVGHDTGGLTGRSAERRLTLPERQFLNPGARLLVAVRKMLALHPEERGPALAALSGLAADDAVWQADSGGYLNLRAIMELLARSPTHGAAGQAAVDATQDRLWQLALHLEEGAPARAEKALAQARRALHEALDAAREKASKPGAAPDAAERAELARREQALQQALQQYMQALRRQAQTDPRHPPAPEQQAMDANRALQQLQQSTQSGTMEDAQQRMAELDQALEALEQARRDAETTPQQRQRAAGRQRGRQQMGVLSDIVRREAGILDHAQARSEPADPARNSLDFPPGLLELQQPTAGQASPGAAAERQGDARIQGALRRALGVLMQQYGDLTGNVPHNLGDADQGMHDALAALGASKDDPAAAAAAQRAIAALEQGGQAMQQQLAEQFGRGRSEQGQGQDPGSDPQGQGEGDEGQSGRDAARPRSDPFGRALQEGAAGETDGAETAVPETMEQARTRAIQDELRRRGADRTRPPGELDYIGRLLNTP
jgi:uncharacterized protein (TIGR02302 family)